MPLGRLLPAYAIHLLPWLFGAFAALAVSALRSASSGVDVEAQDCVACRRGHVATIHPGKDFYIALIEHEDWSAGHTVWGYVDDLAVVDALVALPYTTKKHATYGTEMRMLDEPARFGLSLTPAGGVAAAHTIQQLR